MSSSETSTDEDEKERRPPKRQRRLAGGGTNSTTKRPNVVAATRPQQAEAHGKVPNYDIAQPEQQPEILKLQYDYTDSSGRKLISPPALRFALKICEEQFSQSLQSVVASSDSRAESHRLLQKNKSKESSYQSSIVKKIRDKMRVLRIPERNYARIQDVNLHDLKALNEKRKRQLAETISMWKQMEAQIQDHKTEQQAAKAVLDQTRATLHDDRDSANALATTTTASSTNKSSMYHPLLQPLETKEEKQEGLDAHRLLFGVKQPPKDQVLSKQLSQVKSPYDGLTSAD